MILLTEAQKKKAISIAKSGESPYKYLKGLGVANPTTSWKSILNWARNKLDRNELEDLPESFGPQRKDLEPVVEVADTLPPWKPGTPKPPEEPEKEWTPAKAVSGTQASGSLQIAVGGEMVLFNPIVNQKKVIGT